MLTRRDGKNTDWLNLSLVEIAEGNAQDAYFTLKLFHLLEENLKELNVHYLYDKLISPLFPVFASIEHMGLDVDVKTLEVIGSKLEAIIKEKDSIIRSMPEVGKYKLGSSKDMIQIMFTDENGFTLYPPKFTKKSEAPSTDSECFDILLAQIEEELGSRKDT